MHMQLPCKYRILILHTLSISFILPLCLENNNMPLSRWKCPKQYVSSYHIQITDEIFCHVVKECHANLAILLMMWYWEKQFWPALSVWLKKNWFFSGTHYVVCTVKLLSTVDKPEALCETQEFFRELNYFPAKFMRSFYVPKGAEPALDALQRAS